MGRAVRRGFEVSFNTNGWLVTDARAQAVADAGVSIAYVSLDGATVETVDRSRGRAGSHEKAWGAIERFLATDGPRVVVSCIIHADNAHEMVELVEQCRRRGLQLVIQPLYQNFGNNEYDPDWWKTAHYFPRTPQELKRLDEALDRVHRSNLTKLVDSKPLKNEDGKVLKGPKYQPPNLAECLPRPQLNYYDTNGK